MDRDEAVALYKEILTLDESMGSNSFNLVPTKNGSKTDYQIHIMLSDNELKHQLDSIAKKHNLAVKQESDGKVIIYQP